MNAKASEAPPKSGHPTLSLVLVCIASFLAIFAVFSVWANRQALNTDNWVSTSDQLIQNDAIKTQLSDYIAAELFANVDVEADISKQLPPQLKALAGPAAGGLRQLAPQAADKAISTSQFQDIWSTANRQAHIALLKILDGGGDNLSTTNGEVVLNLNGALTNVSSQIGVGSKLASQLPADAGQITVMQSDQLSTAQKVAKLIRKLPIVLTLLVLILYALAIWLAGPRRRETLRSVGIGLLVAGVVAMIIRRLAGGSVVDALAATESAKPAAQAAWDIGTSLLVTVATSVITLGILILIGAWLAGPTRWATTLRQKAAPYVREQPAATFGVAFLIFIVLVLWAPIAALGTLLGILLFAILFAGGAEVLRRQILSEAGESEEAPPAPDTPEPQAGS